MSVDGASFPETTEISWKVFPLVAVHPSCLKERRGSLAGGGRWLWREAHLASAPGSAIASLSCGISGLSQNLFILLFFI